jgi:hypothetical protein
MFIGFTTRISEHVQNTCFARAPKTNPYRGRVFPSKGRVFPYKKPYKMRVFGDFDGTSIYQILLGETVHFLPKSSSWKLFRQV